MATANPFRFSTKCEDDETGLLYYGFRYYDPSKGRWISRDPLEEFGGIPVYGFLAGSPVNTFDPWGLKQMKCGVEKFHVEWRKGGSNPVFHRSIVSIVVRITFKKDKEHDPRCCEYKQTISTMWTRNRGGKPEEWKSDGYPEERPDGYSRNDNQLDPSRSPDYSRQEFMAQDDPDAGSSFVDGDLVHYYFTARQTVYSTAKTFPANREKDLQACECVPNEKVAEAVHTAHASGTVPNYNYNGTVPWENKK